MYQNPSTPLELSTIGIEAHSRVSIRRMIADMELPQPHSRQHALDAGLTDREIQDLCRKGAWRRVRRGQYVDGSVKELTREQQHRISIAAVLAAASPDAVVSHISAAVLHGLPVWAVLLGRVHLTRNRRSGARKGRQVVLHSAALRADEIVVVDGIRVTSVARTLIDLGCALPMPQAVVLGDAALRRGATTRTDLERQLSAVAGRPGSRSAGRMVAAADGRSESPGESRSRLLMSGELPVPELQAEVRAPDGKLVARVDFLFAELGVIGEFDGKVKYLAGLRGSRTPEEVVIAEKVREDRLRALGWIVVRWTWADPDDPAGLIARIAAAAEIGKRSRRVGSWTAAPRI